MAIAWLSTRIEVALHEIRASGRPLRRLEAPGHLGPIRGSDRRGRTVATIGAPASWSAPVLWRFAFDSATSNDLRTVLSPHASHSGRGLPHSKTLARYPARSRMAEGFGVRLSSGALPLAQPLPTISGRSYRRTLTIAAGDCRTPRRWRAILHAPTYGRRFWSAPVLWRFAFGSATSNDLRTVSARTPPIAAGDCRTPRRWRAILHAPVWPKVLECACPLALWLLPYHSPATSNSSSTLTALVLNR